MPSIFLNKSLKKTHGIELQLIILLIMFSCGLNRKIVYSKFFGIFTSADNNDWYQISWSSNTYGVDNTCSPSQSIIYLDNSPYLKNCVIYKTFILEPHYKVYLQFQFWRIDLWNNNLFTTYADLKIKYQQSFSNLDTITNFCYDSENDEVKNIILSFSHNTPTLMIIFKGDGSRWGISNIQLEIDECSIGCDSCSQSQCFDQKLVPILIDWTTIEIPPLFQSCGGYQFQFTYGNFMQIEIDLDPHNIINLTIKFQIGNADNPTLTVKIDNQLVTTTQQFSDRVSDALFFCHQNQILEMNIVDYDHTNPTIKFRIDAIMIQYDPMSGMPYFGISDFQLFVKTKIKQKDSDLGMPFEGCLLSKPELVEGCTFCVRNICLFCDEGWIYIEQDQKCSPICGDLKLVQNEECDDSNLNPYDGCHNCKYSCPQFCLQCLKGKCRECQFPRILINGLCHLECDQVLTNSVQQKYLGCGFEYLQINGYYQHTLLNNKDNQQFLLYEFLDCNPQSYGIMGYYYNQCNIQYIEQCKKQQWNICLECEDHYQLSFNKQYCVSKCNDEYIEDFEVCDDNNNIQFDSCYKCQPSCQLECLNCVYGKCLYCREGWYLIDQQCQSICGDGIVVPFEQCDDGNLDIGDGCFQCQTECFYCEICNYKNQCQICQEHFHLVQDICLPICGDNYVELGLEECDDGNEVQYDGCFNCQLECTFGCQICNAGQCLDVCQIGEQNINGQCIKVNSNEQNNITLSKQNCSYACLDCYDGQCLLCHQNYTIQNGNCKSIECGNGIREIYEECDDGNTFSNDGCSKNCLIEINWNCITKDKQLNSCYSLTNAYLRYLNQTQYYQYVQLTYSKKVRLYQNYESDQFLFQNSSKIIGLQEDQYLIICYPKSSIVQFEYRHIQYEFKIQFYYQVESQLNFSVFINETLLDENEIAVLPTNISIKLKVPKILTISQLASSQTLKKFGYSMMISLSCSSGLMLFLGEFVQAIKLLDILQYEQFLKYININYPQNVYIFFESSNFITFQPLLNYLKFPDLYQEIIEPNYQQSIGKFREQELNADFLTNINSFLFQLILVIPFILKLYIYEKYISILFPLSKIAIFVDNCKYRIFKTIFRHLYHYKRKNLEIQKIFNTNSFIQFFNANSWDLMFKVGLFLISNNESKNRQRISLLICFCYLAIMMKIFLLNLRKILNRLQIIKHKKIQSEKLILLKKFSFHLILTQMQDHPIYQCILISFFTSSYIFVILRKKFITSKLEIITVLSLEIPIIISILLNLSYCQDFQSYLTLNQQIQIGFAQIGLLIFSLTGPLVSAIYQLYCKFKNSKPKNRKIQKNISTNIFITAF